MPSVERNDKAEEGERVKEGEGFFKLNFTAFYKGHNCAIASLVLTYLRIHQDINLGFKMYAIAFKIPLYFFFVIRKKKL